MLSSNIILFLPKAILIYRLIPCVNKLIVKIIHGFLHLAVLALAAAALKAAFDHHNMAKPTPRRNMFSLHSWIGLSAVILFGLQLVVGFGSFLFPKLTENLRKIYLLQHKFWGIVVFVLCCASALMGITENAFFSLPN